MCDAFSQNNCKVTLILPHEKILSIDNSLKKNFLLRGKKKIKVKSMLNTNIRNFIGRYLFGFKTSLYLKKKNKNLIITRSISTSIFLCIFNIAHFLELHSEQKSLAKFLLINLNLINSKSIIKIIMISNSLSKLYNLNKKKVIILHDGVDIKNFNYSKKKK